ncbi:unnamed protein product [Diamesa hyperborea]
MSRNYQNKKYPNKKGAINPKEKQQISGLDANFRMGIEQFLVEFMENEELMKYEFPESLSKESRVFIHKFVEKNGFNLKTKSFGKDDERRLTIFKIGELVNRSENALLTLTNDSEKLIDNLLKKMKQDKNDYQNKPEKVFRAKKTGSMAFSKSISVPPSNNNGNCLQQKLSLPIYSYKEHILQMIEQNQVLLVQSSTGSGKTTQIPQFIMERASEREQKCKIICAQPRRLSAISVAERVSYERNENIGTTTGYQIRLESKVSSNSNLVYVTNGVLLRCLMSSEPSALFNSITHLIIDEVHERNKFTDFLLIAIKDNLHTNPNLRVIIMSATLESDIFSKYFNGCPEVNVPGKLFDLDYYHLEDILKMTNFTNARVKQLDEKFKKEPKQLLNTNQQGENTKVLDEDTRNFLNDILENMGTMELPESEFNQFFYLVQAENIPVDCRHTQTLMTALMIASARGLLNCVEILLGLGADPTATINYNGTEMNAAQLAGFQEKHDVVKLIQESTENGKMDVTGSRAYDKLLLNIYYDSSVRTGNQGMYLDENIDLDLTFKLINLIHLKYDKAGAILIFLPGYDDICQLSNLIHIGFSGMKDFELFLLHSNMQTQDQKNVFKTMIPGTRKIIISTNIAETSITINDVVYVIDAGKEKQKSYDSVSHSSSLKAQWISKACAKQRGGRAGRLTNGLVFRLYSRDRFNFMIENTIPELLRTELTDICLQTKILTNEDVKIEEFLQKSINPPSITSIRQSIKQLESLGALDENERLTQLGYHLADLPLDAKLGKMLIYGLILQCVDPVLTIVSCLSLNEPFVISVKPGDRQRCHQMKLELSENSYSDHMVLLRCYQKWSNYKSEYNNDRKYCEDNYINSGTMERITAVRSQIFGHLRSNGMVPSTGNTNALNINSSKWSIVKVCLAASLYPNVCRLDRKNHFIRSEIDRKLVINMTSCLKNKAGDKSSRDILKTLPSEWILFDEKTRAGTITMIKCNTVVTSISLAIVAGPSLQIIETDNKYPLNDDDNDDLETDVCGIDNWIKFETDYYTRDLIMMLRSNFENVVLRYLNDVKNYQFTESDKYLIDTLVKVIENEDCDAGFPMKHNGIASRPRYVSSKYDKGNNNYSQNSQKKDVFESELIGLVNKAKEAREAPKKQKSMGYNQINTTQEFYNQGHGSKNNSDFGYQQRNDYGRASNNGQSEQNQPFFSNNKCTPKYGSNSYNNTVYKPQSEPRYYVICKDLRGIDVKSNAQVLVPANKIGFPNWLYKDLKNDLFDLNTRSYVIFYSGQKLIGACETVLSRGQIKFLFAPKKDINLNELR